MKGQIQIGLMSQVRDAIRLALESLELPSEREEAVFEQLRSENRIDQVCRLIEFHGGTSLEFYGLVYGAYVQIAPPG
jgi:hypothetical protein